MFESLTHRKVVEWGLAYLAGAWLVREVVSEVGASWGLPAGVVRLLDVGLLVGFLGTLVLAWYHGEKGRQRASTFEILVLATLLGGGALVASRLDLSTEADPRAGLSRPSAVASVAVLPFRSIGTDEENRVFADGIHEEVLGQLSRVSDLAVISRTSVTRYADTERTVPEIAAELGVGAILEGSVRRAERRVRIAVQLIASAADAPIWSETYDRELNDIFEIQTEIARHVAEALAATLRPEEEARIARPPTDDLDAYDLYLAGKAAHERMTASGIEEGKTFFRGALELDPEFAPAWAALGNAYAIGVGNFGADPSGLDSALVALERARALDPELAEVHRGLGNLYGSRGLWRRSLDASLRALELAPSFAIAASNAGVAHEVLGQGDRAVELGLRALRLDPNRPQPGWNLAGAYATLGLHEAAERVLRALRLEHGAGFFAIHFRATLLEIGWGDLIAARDTIERQLERTPENLPTLLAAGMVALFRRDMEGAERHMGAVIGLAPSHRFYLFTPYPHRVLGQAARERGDVAASEAHLESALAQIEGGLARGEDDPRLLIERAAVRAIRGERSRALGSLEAAYEAGWRRAYDLELDPAFDSLRAEARFAALLDRIAADIAAQRRRVEVAGLDRPPR